MQPQLSRKHVRIAAMLALLAGAISALLIASMSELRADGDSLLQAHLHAGLNCAACHAESPPQQAPPIDKCTGCHGDQAAVAARTKALTPNPHAPPHLAAGETQNCEECHHVHKTSEVTCTDCHHSFQFNMK
jgi:hypothetical protein